MTPRHGRSAARVSAPGKLILAGEHAAVFARPAIVAALGLRVEVIASRARGDGVDLELVDLDERLHLTWERIDAYAARARSRWQDYAAGKIERFVPMPSSTDDGIDPRAHLPALALGEWRHHVAPACQVAAVSLRITSQIPIGAGCGSSAALGAAILSALLDISGWELAPVVLDPAALDSAALDSAKLERLALEVERRQHGRPSGVDTAAVVRGGLLWAERTASEALELSPLEDPGQLASRISVYDSGSPAQSTGETVSAVQALVGGSSEAATAIDEIERATRRLKRAFEEGAAQGLAETFRRASAGLLRIGVVPPAVAEVIAQIEARGGAAKISGAGALSGPAAGCVLVYDPAGASSELLRAAGWGRLEAPLAVAGLERR